MLVNKKLGRLKQWAEERMGGEVKTNTSGDFKALEMEMALRHEGMEKLQRSMTLYVKSVSKRNEADDREKALPVGHLGSTMVAHGDDFEPDSEFGNCLTTFGRANERIARVQETYVSGATSSWLESLERSLAQMKEYQAARKKLEQRRLAYDTSLAKMQKQKKEDFRVEEELRSQKAKYEESNEDVYRRMQDIKEAELDSIADLTAFLEAELTYHDRCREILMQLKREWPASSYDEGRKGTRSRSNTAYSHSDRAIQAEPEPAQEPRAAIPRLNTRGISPAVSTASPSSYSARPANSRTNTYTFEGPTRVQRDMSPASMPRLSRVPTEPSAILANRAQLRSVSRTGSNGDAFDEHYDDPRYTNGSPQRGRSPSPTSAISLPSRSSTWAVAEQHTSGIKKAPPPPPPSRAKKPPPPPPMKRSALSSSEIPHS